MKRLNREDQLARLRQRVDLAKGFRKHEALDDLWKRMLDLYRGRHFPEGLSKQDLITVNVAFSTINVIAPSVAVNHPKLTVTPAAMGLEDQATIAEAVINYWWRRYDFTQEFQAAVKDSLIFGVGWLKVGWRFEEGEQFDAEPAVADIEARREEVDLFASENPELAASLPSDDDIEADMGLVQSERVTIEDRPFLERCSIHDIYVDPEATSMRDMRWIAQKVVKTLEEVEANDAYKKSAVANLRPDSRIEDDWMVGSPDESVWDDQDDIARVTLWEFYDVVEGKMSVFPEIGDEFLIDPVDIPYPFGHPFVLVPNYDVPDQFYCMGELEALEPLQHELNHTRTALFNDRKAFRRAHLYRPDAFDATGKSMLASDADNRLIPVNGNVPLNEAVLPLPATQTNPQLYQDSAVIESDISTVTAVSEYQRGNVAEIRRTATEASLIADASNARAADKLAKVEHVISEVGERLLQLAQEFLDGPQVARITNTQGQPIVFEFQPEDIEGQFDFEVQGGSTRPLNETQRRQQAVEVLNALAPFAASGMVNLQAVLAYALKYGFDVENPERFIQPDPMAQMMQAQGEGMPTEGMPPGMGGEVPPPEGDPGAAPTLPPGMEAQLAGQMGLEMQASNFV